MSVADERRAGIDFPGVSVAFLCHDGHGRVLLHRRGDGCRDERGAWDAGAGALEFGEDPEAAVAREVSEEYGAKVHDLRFLGVRNVVRDGDGRLTHWVALIYTARVDPDSVRIGEPRKIAELGWFTLDELPAPLHTQLEPQLEMYRGAGVA